MNNNNKIRSAKPQGSKRRGALMVCVLVVLAIVAMVTAQGLQSMTVLSRSDRLKDSTAQSRELLAFGKAVLMQGLEDGSITMETADQELQWSVEVEPGQQGLIQIEKVLPKEGQESQPRFRLVAKYPSKTPHEVTVSEVVQWSEQ